MPAVIYVLVDLSYLCYRAAHTLELSHGDAPTGVLFGVLDQLRRVCLDDRVRSNRVLIFADSKKSYRKQLYPLYKHKRHAEHTPEEWAVLKAMRDQRDLLANTILPEVGFPVYRQTGLESDDLMAWVAQDLTHSLHIGSGRQGVMITADGDLFQCISDQVHWYDPGRQAYHTPASLLFTRGVTPQQWARVKVLAGCHTDNVPGVPGVGEKTAVKYLQGNLPPRLRARQAIDNARSVIKRNERLVVLPHKRTKPVELRDPQYDADRFFHYCRRYGLALFLREAQAWKTLFSGKLFGARKVGS